MSNPHLYMIHGMGPDAVGLVGRMTSPIAQARGNILDLRQDVLHGLFTIYMVVDLSQSSAPMETFHAILREISDDTGLKLTIDRYAPVPRNPQKKNLLIICVGKDQPGIVAASSKMLGQYHANIEFSRSIAREGVFLMELLTDVSQVAIPVANLQRAVRANMESLGIRAVFQDQHVFIRRKRLIVFQIKQSFIAADTVREILRQTGISPEEMAAALAADTPGGVPRYAVSRLEGLPLEVLDRVLAGILPTAGSIELVQTLKVMGYKVLLASSACDLFVQHLRRQLDIDDAYGTPFAADDDSRTLTGELSGEGLGGTDLDAVLAHLTAAERVDRDDITVITDEGCSEPPGIRVDVKLEVLLDCYNQRVLSRENLIGLLGSFGIPAGTAGT